MRFYPLQNLTKAAFFVIRIIETTSSFVRSHFPVVIETIIRQMTFLKVKVAAYLYPPFEINK